MGVHPRAETLEPGLGGAVGVPSSPQKDAEIVNTRADARRRRSRPSPDPRANDESTSSEVGWGGESRPEGRGPRRNHGNRVRHGSEQPYHGHLAFGGCGDKAVRGSVCLGAERPLRLAPLKVSPLFCYRFKAQGARREAQGRHGGPAGPPYLGGLRPPSEAQGRGRKRRQGSRSPFLDPCTMILVPSALRHRGRAKLVPAEKTGPWPVFYGAPCALCLPTKNIVNPQEDYPS